MGSGKSLNKQKTTNQQTTEKKKKKTNQTLAWPLDGVSSFLVQREAGAPECAGQRCLFLATLHAGTCYLGGRDSCCQTAAPAQHCCASLSFQRPRELASRGAWADVRCVQGEPQTWDRAVRPGIASCCLMNGESARPRRVACVSVTVFTLPFSRDSFY